MSFDTKYRPLKFEDVVGQKGTVDVLKKLVTTDQVFHKSYIFAGPSGTGKTTTARILARAMLCDDVDPDTGEPCNQCESCREIIDGTSSFSFIEMDAANNSGADKIRQIVDELDYYTLGGKDRKIYLIDECHRLSAQAMDALLKPMEDNVTGSKDKRLVCLFCTTEPEKIRNTIKARCMMFGIKEPEREEAVDRLRWICEQENISHTEDALDIIYSFGRGQIRDMVNALERVSQAGPVTSANSRKHLGLGAVSNYYLILEHIQDDLPKALSLAEETLRMVDPPAFYEGLADAAMASYRASWDILEGIGYVDQEKAKKVFDLLGENVLWIADRILGSSKKIDENVLTCELVILHRYLNDGTIFSSSSVQGGRGTAPKQVNPNDSCEDSSDDSSSDDTDDDTTTIPSGYNVDVARDLANDISQTGSHFVNPDMPAKPELGDEDDVNSIRPLNPTKSDLRNFSAQDVREFDRRFFDD